MSGDVAEKPQRGGKKGLRRPKRRLSIHIDMTPMVDIAFLLLIFYMVSTVFSQPQAMEINLPDPEEAETEIEVKASNLLTLWVAEDNAVFWLIGIANPDSLPSMLPGDPNADDSLGYVIDSDALVRLMAEKNRANSFLSTLILIHRDARFSTMVELLDDIDLLERSWNAQTAQKLGKETKELTKADGKFSYRYAMGKWQNRDGRIIEAARDKALGI
ncbi:MAG: biopolymer transporter ExbD [candidate division Zixibacteria bacterium]|nr:biopolymer transporter ExbD [candidate division Zixibacteria bacterium]